MQRHGQRFCGCAVALALILHPGSCCVVSMVTVPGRSQVPRLQEAAAAPAWGRLLQAALALLAQAANGSAAPEDDVLDVEEFAGGMMQCSKRICEDAH